MVRYGDWAFTKIKNPVKITDGPVKDFAAGASSIYVVRPDGSLWTAGYNSDGRLGDGTTVHRSSLVKVIDSGVKKVFSKGKYAAVIKEDGSLWTFGINTMGQLGNSCTNRNIRSGGCFYLLGYYCLCKVGWVCLGNGEEIIIKMIKNGTGVIIFLRLKLLKVG